MSDFLTEDTKAIILLCGFLGKDGPEKPLSMKEYSLLVHWLIQEKMRPGDLLRMEHTNKASVGTGIDEKRLKSLLGRGVQLGFAVEEWQRDGIWLYAHSSATSRAKSSPS